MRDNAKRALLSAVRSTPEQLRLECNEQKAALSYQTFTESTEAALLYAANSGYLSSVIVLVEEFATPLSDKVVKDIDDYAPAAVKHWVNCYCALRIPYEASPHSDSLLFYFRTAITYSIKHNNDKLLRQLLFSAILNISQYDIKTSNNAVQHCHANIDLTAAAFKLKATTRLSKLQFLQLLRDIIAEPSSITTGEIIAAATVGGGLGILLFGGFGLGAGAVVTATALSDMAMAALTGAAVTSTASTGAAAAAVVAGAGAGSVASAGTVAAVQVASILGAAGGAIGATANIVKKSWQNYQHFVSYVACSDRIKQILHACLEQLTMLDLLYLSMIEPTMLSSYPSLTQRPEFREKISTIKYLRLNHGLICDSLIIEQLIPILNQAKALVTLDLSHNQITRDGLKALLEQVTLAELTNIYLCDNKIQCCDEADWENEFEKWVIEAKRQRLPKLNRIDISGNAVSTNNVGITINAATCAIELYQKALHALLRNTSITLEQFSIAKWRGVTMDEEGAKYVVKLKLSRSEKIKIRLDFATDYHHLTALRTASISSELSVLFAELQKGIKNCYLDPANDWTADTCYQQLPRERQQVLLNDLTSFHPGAPLSRLIQRHKVYHSQPDSHIYQSLLFQQPLTQNDAYVYLLACKDNEHAVIVLEFLTPDGQRVLDSAHLFKEGITPKIDRRYKGYTLEALVSQILSKNIIAQFKATTTECQNLLTDINKEKVHGLNNIQYRSLGCPLTLSDIQGDQLVHNCLTWALNKIDTHLSQDNRPSTIANLPTLSVLAFTRRLEHQPGPRHVASNSTLVLSDQATAVGADELSPCFPANSSRQMHAIKAVAARFFEQNQHIGPKKWRAHATNPRTYFMLFKPANKSYADNLQKKLGQNHFSSKIGLTISGKTKLAVKF